jgi:HAD superfamily hydrolase (TIGR01509 family)
VIDCDFDDVLVDFVTAALEVHGRADVLAEYPAGVWHLKDVLGITRDEFWQPIDALGPGFWAGLAPLPWADELLTLLEACDEVAIATAPHPHPHCYAGKFLSLTGHFGGRFADPHKHHFTAAKQRLADKQSILIDDSAANVKAYIDAGGEAILFPQPWNYLGAFHPTGESKLAYVRNSLERIAERKTWHAAKR